MTNLRTLRDWVPEIGDLATATRNRATGHANASDFYQALVKASTWEGDAADEATASVLMAVGAHDVRSEDLTKAADAMDQAGQEAQTLANTVKDILDDAAESPAVEVNQDTNQVSAPANYDYLDEDTQAAVTKKISDLQTRISKALTEGEHIDTELAHAMAQASGVPEPTASGPTSLEDLLLGPLKPGEVRDLGPVAGTDNPDAIDNNKAADLGEIITLPDGTQVAIFGDSYGEPHVAGEGNPHYSSVAVPVTFDKDGKPHFGKPLNGTNPNSGFGNETQASNALFPLPPEAIAAGANNTLPAGSIVTRDGRTLMLIVGTDMHADDPLKPVGSWLVEVNNDPAGGWRPIQTDSHGNPVNTYRSAAEGAPTQLSGYQGSDGNIHIAADSFDRQQGVSVYSVDPEHLTDRNAWRPYNPTDNTWGAPGQPAAETITPRGQHWGELSFREIDGKPVLSGTNLNNTTPNGVPTVEVHVGDSPTSVVRPDVPPTVVMSNERGAPNYVPGPYGGYILPGSTLENLNIFGSQWFEPKDEPLHYGVHHIHANVTPVQR